MADAISRLSGAPRPVRAPRPMLGLALGFVGMVIFGATLPMTRVALRGFDPAVVTLGRGAFASIVAGAALIAMRRRLPVRDLPAFGVIAVTLVFGFAGLIAVAMQTVPASHGGIVLGLIPLLTAVFAALFGGERPGALFWACSLVGAGLVVGFTLRGGGFVPGIGHVWLGLAAVIFALGSFTSGKLARHLPGWEVIAWTLVLSAPVTIAGTAISWRSGVHAPGWAEIGALAYLALGSMFGGFVFWNAGLALGGIARVGQVQLLQTFATLGFSALLLGERITWVEVGFAAAVVAVVWLGRKARVG